MGAISPPGRREGPDEVALAAQGAGGGTRPAKPRGVRESWQHQHGNGGPGVAKRSVRTYLRPRSSVPA